jgi:hypothetical protein
MMSFYLAFGSIFVQELAGSGVRHLPAGILFVLGSLLFALGTMVRRSLSVREGSTKPHLYQPWAETVSAETNHRSVKNIRGQETPSTSANAA